MPNENTIEVVVCTFNGEKLLSDQLKSILAQTHRINVISIHDDGSIDDTLSLVETFRDQFESVGIEYKISQNSVNLGYAQNFSQAVAKSTCEIIFLCDQDDIWESTKVLTMSQLFQYTAVDMVFSDGLVVDASGKPLSGCSVLESYQLPASKLVAFNRDPLRFLACRNYVNGCAAALRRSAALQAGPPPSGMPHDYWYALWCALHGGIIGLPNRLYKYRQHENNAIGIGRSTFIHQFFSILRSPIAPRQRELGIVSGALDRLERVSNPGVNLLREKLKWMNSIVGESRRLCRLSHIFLTLIQGRYSSFGQPYALLRDLISCVK